MTADPETVLALLRRFGVSEGSPPRESQVSEIMQTLSRYAGEGSPLCDVGAVVKAICSLVRLLIFSTFQSSTIFTVAWGY